MWIASLIGMIGQGISGFFGFKQAQAETLNNAIGAIGAAQDADAQYAQASAQAISALYESGPPVERLWRPIAMWIFMIAIIARWFGYVPPHLPAEEIANVYNWFEIGLIGYLPLRSVDKWMKGFQIGSILKTFISKKIG